jgi:hypothetical protein
MFFFHAPLMYDFFKNNIPKLKKFECRKRRIDFCMEKERGKLGGAISLIPYQWVISTIRYDAATKIEYRDLENPYVNLSKHRVVNVTGMNYVLDDLIEMGVLKCDGLYSAGLKSFGYKFTEEFKLIKFEIFKGAHHLNEEAIKILKDAPVDYEYIISSMDHFSMDIAAAKKDINPFCSESQKENYTMTLDAMNYSIQIKDYNFSINSTGRCFYALTNQKKVFRKFWKLCGQDIFIADVTSCQPAIVYSFYKGTSDESNFYKHLIETGAFYEFFIDAIKNEFCEDISRDNIKCLIYRIWFGKVKKFESKRVKMMRSVFDRKFPILSKILDDMRGDDHCVIARTLQKTESSTMYHKVIPKMREAGIECLTIHDSVVVRKEKSTVAARILQEEFSRALGVQVFVKSEFAESPSKP